MKSITRRVVPLVAKAKGEAPLCPWRSAFALLSPNTIREIPPAMKIEEVDSDGDLVELQFGGKHRFWFPRSMPVDQSLWSEYLVGFWNSPVNFHNYFSKEVGIGKGDVVVDCGACEGFFTKAALELGAGKVICVEPSPRMTACLRKTFASEIEDGKVVIEQVAVGALSGTANFSDTDIFGGHIGSEEGQAVQITTLDLIAGKHGDFNFVKMDLEGVEYEALSGARQTLKRCHPKLAITTYHYPWDYPVVRSLLTALDYRHVRPRGVTMRNDTIPRPMLLLAH